nr:helix-turn-helix domain-containing protein [Ornithinimicrobium sp. F0845]
MGQPGTHRGLPSTALTLVLPVGGQLEVGWAGVPASRGRWQAGAGGLHSTPAEIHHDGWQAGVQLSLTTAGARALLGESAADLAHELVDLADLRGSSSVPGPCHLPERLHDAATWAQRLLIVESALIAALARHGAAGPRSEVGRALASLTRGASVRSVADDVGWSRRHLGTQVRAEAGLTPKEFQRVARFERSHRRLLHTARAGAVHLGALAADTGYADQAHLTREWGLLAGCTPRAWLRAEFVYLQDRPALQDDPGEDGHHRSTDTGRP